MARPHAYGARRTFTQVQLPGGDGDDDLVVHEHGLEVGIAIVLAGAVVAVVGAVGSELLEPLPDVLMEA